MNAEVLRKRYPKGHHQLLTVAQECIKWGFVEMCSTAGSCFH